MAIFTRECEGYLDDVSQMLRDSNWTTAQVLGTIAARFHSIPSKTAMHVLRIRSSRRMISGQ